MAPLRGAITTSTKPSNHEDHLTKFTKTSNPAFTCIERSGPSKPARSRSGKNAVEGAQYGDVLAVSWEDKRRPGLIGRRRVFSVPDRGPTEARYR